MRVLLVGASGLIGSAIAGRLVTKGHEVLAAGRRSMAQQPGLRHAHLDLRKAASVEAWRPLVSGVDAVINCAGVLQDSSRDSTQAVHAAAPRALFQACAQAGVKRVIHFSAIGVDRETPSAFSASKAEGDAALMASGLDYVILRPSVVLTT